MPPDGRFLFYYNSRSTFETFKRIIKAQKFYRTLGPKIDREIEKINEIQSPHPNNWEQIDHPSDGSDAQKLLGGTLQARYKFREDDADRKI